MTHYTNLAFVRARPGRSDELGEALLALVAPSRGEPSCISYDVQRSKEDPDLWMLYENWRSADGLDRHFFRPHMHAFAVRSSELVEGDFDFRGFTRLSDPAWVPGSVDHPEAVQCYADADDAAGVSTA